MKKQLIIRKQRLIDGCIPACALSVLDYLGLPPGILPTEAELLTLNTTAGQESGYRNLDHSIRLLKLPVKIMIIEGWDKVKARIHDPNRADEPILVAHSSPSGAHSVVVTSVNEKRVLVHDPWPENPDTVWKTIDWLANIACGDAAEIENK